MKQTYNRHKHEAKSNVMKPTKVLKAAKEIKIVRCNETLTYTINNILTNQSISISKDMVFDLINEPTKVFHDECKKLLNEK